MKASDANYNLLTPVKNGDLLSFKFEEDFVEHNVRCIPMIVRFKLDLSGIKLKLEEWSMFNLNDRKLLMQMPCNSAEQLEEYSSFLGKLIRERTGHGATILTNEPVFAWADTNQITEELQSKANEWSCTITTDKWKELNNLQRFALLKLCRPGHENRNFPKAMEEFGLMK